MLPVFSRDLEPVVYSFWRPLLRQFDELLDQPASPASERREQGRTELSPSYDLDETDDHYVMSFDIPGVHRDDLQIDVTGDLLTVSGERKSDGRAGRRYGKFQRQFSLPAGVTAENVAADYKDGVLTLAVQKPAAAKPTKVKIGDGSHSKSFLKSLIGDKKVKDPVDVKGTSYKSEPAAVAN